MASLVDLVSASVPLRRAGKRYIGRCPVHNEKTPSFHVFEAKRGWRYHCFGCGFGGDAIAWVMHWQHVPFREAQRILGQEPARPDPVILAARQAEQRRQQAIEAYRTRNPDCSCPDWLLAT